MNFALSKLSKYCQDHTSPQSQALNELERETYLKTLSPQMLSGHLQGRLLSMLSKMKKPNTILEIGTFTGYTAICLAQGLTETGQLHTIEANEELEHIIRKYIEKTNLTDKIQLYIGDAKQIVPKLEINFDMVFIDAGKKENSLYYDLVIDKVNAGGVILVDNVLWSGKVVQKHHDNDTRIIDEFNKKVHQDERVENVLLPIRDGLIILRKKE